MATYNLALVTKKLYEFKIKAFSLDTLKEILGVESDKTLLSIVKRLRLNNVLEKIERDKYVLSGAGLSDFYLSSFIYESSYISFESALNYYGIISQFPFEISAVTTKKTIKKIIKGKVFNYIHIKKTLFWGYEKKDGFLIAYPEKALLDQIYLTTKGLRKLNLKEYDFSSLDMTRFKEFLSQFPQTNRFKDLVNIVKEGANDN